MYLLDANVFIEAKNSYYDLDVCPAFWAWLQDAHERDLIFTVEAVRKELLAQNDELRRWAMQLPPTFFLKPNRETTPAMADITAWLYSCNKYEPLSVGRYIGTPDFYLVAQAKATGMKVVSREKHKDSPIRIKVPDVCDGVGVKRANLFQILKDDHPKFVLSP